MSGAGSGIGRAVALRLLNQGHSVFGLGRDARKLEAVSREAPGFAFASVDLSGNSQAHVAKIRGWLGSRKLLGLVNNAGVFDRLPFLETSDEIWDRQFQNCLMSAVRLTRALYPELKAAGGAAVVNVSSTLGIRPVASTAAYSAMKAAMLNWSGTLALEWAKDRIRVNCVCPGVVDTPIHAFHGPGDQTEDRVRAHAMQPLGRMGRPEDIAESVSLLLDQEWTTGAVLSVDGGIGL